MMGRSIRFRLTVWYAAVLTAGLGLFGGMIWVLLQHRLFSDIDQDLAGRASRFERYFQGESAEVSSDAQLRDELDEFCQALPPGSYISLRGASFSFRYPESPDTPPPGLQAKPDGSGVKPGFRMIGRPFVSGGETYDLEVGTPIVEVLRTLDLLRVLLWSLIPVVVVIACVGGAWLSRRALKPVQDIAAAAWNISIENLSDRLPVPPTRDEVAELTEVLNTMLARLESAVKTLSQFVADASHELRTPLSVIRTSAELALRRERTPESYRDALQEVAGEATRMTQLVEDLLMLARNDAALAEIPLTPLAVRDVVRDVCLEMQGLAAARGIRITPSLGAAEAVVAGNRAALHRLFLALLDNAVKYSPENSEVTAQVTQETERTSAVIVVAIRDSGAGISSADLPHIFRRFYRADRARSSRGHGLGLSLAETIARVHGARIEVASTEGAGSIFKVWFPASSVAETAAPETPRSEIQSRG
jgi:two-component system heavy metal sensor histidine kinase CusS